MNNRTKMLLSAAAVILVVAVIAVMLLQSPTGGLSGATALVISPSSPVIMEGKTLDLTVNSTYRCTWFASNAAVSFVGDAKEVKTVTIQADAVGSATIEARCGLVNVNKVTTSVTVNPALTISPANPSVFVGNPFTLSVPSLYTCNWSSSNPAVTISGPISGSSISLTSTAANQNATISAECGNSGSASTNVTIQALAFTFNYQNNFAGETFLVNAPDGAIQPCTWTISEDYVQFWVNGQATTEPQIGSSVTLYYDHNPYTSVITISCLDGIQRATMGATVCEAGDTNCYIRR